MRPQASVDCQTQFAECSKSGTRAATIDRPLRPDRSASLAEKTVTFCTVQLGTLKGRVNTEATVRRTSALASMRDWLHWPTTPCTWPRVHCSFSGCIASNVSTRSTSCLGASLCPLRRSAGSRSGGIQAGSTCLRRAPRLLQGPTSTPVAAQCRSARPVRRSAPPEAHHRT